MNSFGHEFIRRTAYVVENHGRRHRHRHLHHEFLPGPNNSRFSPRLFSSVLLFFSLHLTRN